MVRAKIPTISLLLMLVVGIVAVAWGCSPVGSATAPSPKAVTKICTDQGIEDGASFISTRKVQYLSGNTIPYLQYPDYRTPTGQPGLVGPPYSDVLAAAFDNAPPPFQAELCSLGGVFINLNSCSGPGCLNNAWGYRETLTQYPPGYHDKLFTYIAIPRDLWVGNWAQTYH